MTKLERLNRLAAITNMVHLVNGVALDMVHMIILKYLILGSRSKELNGHYAEGFSLYKISMIENVSIATLYRRALELMNHGILTKMSRGNYTITTKGYFTILYLYITRSRLVDNELATASLRRLKQNWGLEEFSDDEVFNYVKLLVKGMERRRLSVLGICVDSFPRTVFLILPEKFKKKPVREAISEYIGDEALVKPAERVIAKAILELFPTVTLKDGCEAALMIWGRQGDAIRYRTLALRCRIHGYTLGECPVANNLINFLLH